MFTGPSLVSFRRNLLAWFAQFHRDLPWRRNKDPYRIWVSEIMLQQTRVAAAIPYFERFLASFPNVSALAAAPEEEVLRLWSGLGYYSRARNLQKAARQIVAQHDGLFPVSPQDVLALSGIGEYTARAILSIAHGKKHAVLDGNVARVIARLGALRGDLRSNGRWRELQEKADILLDPHAPGDWNEAVMELGATICTPRSPQCPRCPVNPWCKALKQDLVDFIPEKRNRRATEEITLAALVFADSKGNTLLLSSANSPAKTRGHANLAALLSRLWHFPTIEVRRDAAQEMRAHVESNFLHGKKLESKLQPLKKIRHAVTYRSITLLPFRLELSALPSVPHSKILPLADLSSAAISNLTRKVGRSAQI